MFSSRLVSSLIFLWGRQLTDVWPSVFRANEILSILCETHAQCPSVT